VTTTPTPHPQRTRIFLAHASHGSGASYRSNLARLRLLEAGLRVVSPELCFVRALGHTPEDDPATDGAPSVDCLQTLARRLILGDARAPGAVASTSALPPCAAVWVVSRPDTCVSEQIRLAEEAGLPVAYLDEAEQESTLLLGGLAGCRGEQGGGLPGSSGSRLTPRGAPLPTLPGGLVDDEGQPDRAPFSHPLQVVEAYFSGAAEILGARGLPIDQCRVQNGSNAAGMKSRAERCGLRIAAANGIVWEVRETYSWGDREEAVWELHGRYELPFEEVAVRVGYAGRDGAWRCWQRALGEIADVLRARR
jgi:hypothetical protein